VKIATWNVNSIRARENIVLDWVEANDPDVLMMQETKIPDQEFPEDGFGDLDYDVVFHGQPTYNGVAIASHHEITDVVRGMPGDDELAERRLLAATIEGIRIFCVYVPNGRQIGSETFRYKLDWLDRFTLFVQANLRPDQPAVIAGDFNIAPGDADVWDVERYHGALFATEDERSRFRKLIEWGFVDMVAHTTKEPHQFTWWDYRAGNFQKNRGLRIDHVLATKPIVERTTGVSIHRDVRAGLDPSDHVPVMLSLDDA
jgi:exodeoxyribonuclease III